MPIIIIFLCDTPLLSFNQFLLMGLIVTPHIKNAGGLGHVTGLIKNKTIQTLSFISLFILALCVFVPSIAGHYYYSKDDLDNAIRWDQKNALYYFTRGAEGLNQDTEKSEADLIKATSLAPSVSYFYGFLGAAQLANNKIEAAKKSLENAIKLDGNDGYWCLLYSYANFDNKKIYSTYRDKAFKRNPEIKTLLQDPTKTSSQFIGYSRHGDVRLAGFYRTGKRLFFPLPAITEK